MEKKWNAKWIMDKRFLGLSPINVFKKQLDKTPLPEHNPELKNLHMFVRKKFHLEKQVKNAYIDITADDYYKLYINGVYIGQGPAPSYYFHYYYNRYDVTDLLKPGDNVIAVHVYYQGLINRVWNSGDLRQGMIAELFIDGTLFLATDSSWKYIQAKEYTGTETTGYDTQFLEHIDNRLKEEGWKETDYSDSMWNPACVNPYDDHKLVKQCTPVLEVYEIAPKEVKLLHNGHYFIDFGQEITGQFKMKAKGLAGQKIYIMCGEELAEEGEYLVRYNMRCNCNYRETWTLSGKEDVLEQYDYKAFRYVEIEAPADTVEPDSFRAVVRHYPFNEESCRFYSSNHMLNKIWDICKNGVKYGSQEVFVDCPSREKGQYLGDITVTAHSHLYLTGDLLLFKKALKNFALSASICPGLMAVAPGSLMQEIADYSLQWPVQLLNYYLQSGDISFLEEMYPVAEGLIEYFKKYERYDGLIENVNEKWNLVDWPENLRDGYDFDLGTVVGDGCHNVINAFYYGAVKTVNEIREILGKTGKYDLERIKQAFINAFYRPEKKLFADSTVSSHSALHSNVVPLFYGLVPDDAIDSVINFIREKKLSCGVYMAYFLLKGLARAGAHDLAYNLIVSDDTHSWSNMLKEGATTCFEAWGKDQKWNTSLCHPWASCPVPVLIEDIAGIKPGKPGWEEISFDPHIPASLTHLTIEFNTVKGRIKLEHHSGKTELVAPAGVRIVRKN